MNAIVLVGFSALAATGFASIAASRFRVAANSYRLGHRLELIQSCALGFVMSLFAAAAAYGAFMRGLSLATGFDR